MAVFKRVVVAQHERALVWKNRRFERVLEPGVRWIFDPLKRVEVQAYDLTVPEFEHPRVDFLVKDAREAIDRHLQVVELEDREVGLVFRNEHLVSVLAPGKRQLYWRGPIDIRVELQSIADEFAIDAATARLLARAKGSLAMAAADAVSAVEVPDGMVGLLLVDGELKRTLAPGLHAF
ncbi:MAG: slipin family protein, partial [bacterium]